MKGHIMDFVGNKNGPGKSVIVDKLGPQYSGITSGELKVEIENYRDEESRGVVDPVYANGETQRFYLDENGYTSEGNVLIEKEGKNS
jgi:hypothetical protein